MGIRNENSRNSKKRNVVDRSRKTYVMIIAEGKYNTTEKLYFQAMKKYYAKKLSINIINDYATDPGNMMDTLINRFVNVDVKDKWAFCLVDSDTDSHKDSQMGDAERKAQRANRDFDIPRVQLIVSSPCFEVWYICHYTSVPYHYNSSREVKEKVKDFIPDYSENKDVYHILREMQNIAIDNAKTLEKHCIENGYKPHTVDFMPSTEVYKIFGLLNL